MKACIFDMDGTLLDSMPHWRRLNQDFLDDHRLTVPDTIAAALPTMSSKRSSVLYADLFPHLHMSGPDILADYMRRMHGAYLSEIGEKPGAGAFLQQLRARGIPYCVATTTDAAIATDALRHAGMLEGCAFVLCTKDLGLSKGDPACFEAIAARLGVAPAECTVFEDALYAIEGAHRAGCTVYAIEDAASAHDRKAIAPLCTAFIADYAQLY